MAADGKVTPPLLPKPERTIIECGVCPFKASGATEQAARAAFREHYEWHRRPPDLGLGKSDSQI